MVFYAQYVWPGSEIPLNEGKFRKTKPELAKLPGPAIALLGLAENANWTTGCRTLIYR
jgi:hypothetical protein